MVSLMCAQLGQPERNTSSKMDELDQTSMEPKSVEKMVYCEQVGSWRTGINPKKEVYKMMFKVKMREREMKGKKGNNLVISKIKPNNYS